MRKKPKYQIRFLTVERGRWGTVDNHTGGVLRTFVEWHLSCSIVKSNSAPYGYLNVSVSVPIRKGNGTPRITIDKGGISIDGIYIEIKFGRKVTNDETR